VLWILSETLVLLGLGLRGLHLFAPRAGIPDLAGAAVSLVFLAVQLALATLGALIVSRRRGNPIGWIFCAAGLVLGLVTFAESYAVYALAGAPETIPGGEMAAWLTSLVQGPSLLGFFVFLLLLFPDGRLPSPRWRPVAWLAFGVIAAVTLLEAFRPGPLGSFPSVTNPLGLDALGSLIGPAREITFLLLVLALLASAVSLVLRFRRSGGVERQQLKWLAASGALVAAVFLMSPIIWSIPALAGTFWSILFGLAFATLPVSAGIAVLRYRLYDIDLIINRALVYGSLTAVVVGLYVLVVGGLGALVQARGSLPLSLLAAGLVAVLFAPLRDRLQRRVNRLMYGERDDPYKVLSRLGQQLEATLEPQAVLPSVVQTVREALRLPYAAVALRHEDGLGIVASAGEPVPQLLRLPLAYRGEQVGELVLGPRAGEGSFSSDDRRLLEDLARQAGVAVHAVRLTADLQRSRERLVTAREEERRRLRHDLHDGLGPALASMSLQLAAARNLVGDRPEAAEMLATLKGQMHDAVADIRRVVYALRPPVLDELGLVAAIGEYAARLGQGGLGIRLEAPESLPPLSAAVEVAAYRIALEALTNVARHSGARSCAIRLSIADRVLRLEVADDGRGLGPNARTGTGLTSMRERAQELGGTLEIKPAPGGGTTVRIRLPLGDTDG
jgi:signal transduction histidine kinase